VPTKPHRHKWRDLPERTDAGVSVAYKVCACGKFWGETGSGSGTISDPREITAIGKEVARLNELRYRRRQFLEPHRQMHFLEANLAKLIESRGASGGLVGVESAARRIADDWPVIRGASYRRIERAIVDELAGAESATGRISVAPLKRALTLVKRVLAELHKLEPHTDPIP
jgi:hypothetical protein